MDLDLVDVFASAALTGNPLAVVRGGQALDDAAMLALTRWLGFSETTFLLEPTDPAADYRVRIFYPAGELPFAGHPTLGSARAWLAAGGQPRRPGVVVQQCGIGLVEVRIEDDRLAFRAPPLIRSGPLDHAERADAVRIAGVQDDDVIAAVHACNGPGWKLLHLRDAAAVLAAKPVPEAPVPTDVGLVGALPAGNDAAFEVRAFFTDPQGRLREDPVTGSLNAAIALYLFEQGLGGAGYVAAQGRLTGADGAVHVTRDGTAAWIGGKAVLVTQGGALPRW
ncbi:PhzF family phenazine biosynthesis protein [Novosphingobium sp. FKTRR1]|uniref:PhzF family phenazine biosynthesis protein n=1 Tax=Novosphingobium sp. FKTRR1 TaxID=2879118 RepID=UPI001CF0602E|nr:PhzF family phenazine biosynthesis protein [Novosphingobium sp. FKTRR1]